MLNNKGSLVLKTTDNYPVRPQSTCLIQVDQKLMSFLHHNQICEVKFDSYAESTWAFSQLKLEVWAGYSHQHAWLYALTNTYGCTHTPTRMAVHTHQHMWLYTLTYTYGCTYSPTRMAVHTHQHVWLYTLSNTYGCTHSAKRMAVHTHQHVWLFTLTNTYGCTHSATCMAVATLTLTNTYGCTLRQSKKTLFFKNTRGPLQS